MKKVFIIFLISFALLFSSFNIYGFFNGKVKLKEKDEKDLNLGDEFSLLLTIEDNDVIGKRVEILGDLVYDTKNVELISESPITLDDWVVFFENNEFFAYGEIKENENYVAEFIFKIKDEAEENFEIRFTNIEIVEDYQKMVELNDVIFNVNLSKNSDEDKEKDDDTEEKDTEPQKEEEKKKNEENVESKSSKVQKNNKESNTSKNYDKTNRKVNEVTDEKIEEPINLKNIPYTGVDKNKLYAYSTFFILIIIAISIILIKKKINYK